MVHDRSRFAWVFSFGSSTHTVVEIVALQDAEFVINCCFLDGCTEVWPGNSLAYRFHGPAELCFVATDLSAEVSISGNISHDALEISKSSICRRYNSASQIPQNFIVDEWFQMIRIASEAEEDLELVFTGSDPAFKYGRVTKQTGTGIVGVNGVSPFPVLEGEPPCPP
jgi:hypothetical protein